MEHFINYENERMIAMKILAESLKKHMNMNLDLFQYFIQSAGPRVKLSDIHKKYDKMYHIYDREKYILITAHLENDNTYNLKYIASHGDDNKDKQKAIYKEYDYITKEIRKYRKHHDNNHTFYNLSYDHGTRRGRKLSLYSVECFDCEMMRCVPIMYIDQYEDYSRYLKLTDMQRYLDLDKLRLHRNSGDDGYPPYYDYENESTDNSSDEDTDNSSGEDTDNSSDEDTDNSSDENTDNSSDDDKKSIGDCNYTL